MPTAERKPTTAEGFFDWLHHPDRGDHLWELEAGRVVREWSHEPAYDVIVFRIAEMLGTHVRSHAGPEVIEMGTGLVVRRQLDTVRKACIAVYPTESHSDALEKGFAQAPPLMVVEMDEPGKAIGQTLLRVSDFLRMGVPLVWLVHPQEQVVTTYRPGHEHQVLEASDELCGEPALSGFRCRVSALFVEGEQPIAKPLIVEPRPIISGEASLG